MRTSGRFISDSPVYDPTKPCENVAQTIFTIGVAVNPSVYLVVPPSGT
jgi:hypothetical protein